MSHLTYVRVSDLNPGEPVPWTMGYGPPQKDLYQASTWDIYGMDDPPYPSGPNGNMYVPLLARHYQGDPNMFGSKGYPEAGQVREAPAPEPIPERAPKVESFMATPSTPKKRKSKKNLEEELESVLNDEIYVSRQKKSYRLKNPVLVFAFLLAFAGAIIFFWEGVEQYLVSKFGQGNVLSWKMRLFYAGLIFGLIFLVAYLMDLNLLGVEELNE